ncbi:hypothetical protein A2372_01955 [Candidatus Wolfebacteria bacterium RIFOXYB1_FULL_54_12]|uniref:Rubrerythrin rubredoxin-like domain-containing protein n=1 Tax=Candidatus Wolfebacteria bacterium RIFOXYB1_FULL_54_12 TaxID=1802559 RepID=A0A1F8DXB7_9BACT|nr:MAG: hypothetical protein A2372_01955 [Candidatus Wolfebacteria bacterium RIFOXYB1_FULL_54_12]
MVPPAECPNCGALREEFNKLEFEPLGSVYVSEEHIPRHKKRWECDACGRVELSDESPAECASCGATKEHFGQLDGNSAE